MVRSVLFFPCGREQLYGSLYAAERPSGRTALILCPSWGHEMAELVELSHALARGMARLGGAGFVFHPPGHGDSTGELDLIGMSDLVEGAEAAARTAGAVAPGFDWALAGIRLGASVAALAAARGSGSVVALIQPVLDPPAYFDELRRFSRRLSPGGEPGERSMVFGHPLSPDPAQGVVQEDVRRALDMVDGPSVVVHCEGSPPHPVVRYGELVTVPGRWRHPQRRRDLLALADATLGWVREAA
jgi:alpha-beta hydrolase superfamily lysophospholipase